MVVEECAGLEFIWPIWAVGVVGVRFVPRARLTRSTWVLGLTLGRIHSMGIFDAVYVGVFAFIPRAHLMRSTWVLGVTLGRACARFDCVGLEDIFQLITSEMATEADRPKSSERVKRAVSSGSVVWLGPRSYMQGP